MLQVDTEEQLRMVAALLGEDFDEWTIGEYPIRTLSLARPISFEEMGKVVDYIRAQGDGKVQQNKETTTMAEDRKLKSYKTSQRDRHGVTRCDANHYLMLEDLEKLPGLPKED